MQLAAPIPYGTTGATIFCHLKVSIIYINSFQIDMLKFLDVNLALRGVGYVGFVLLSRKVFDERTKLTHCSKFIKTLRKLSVQCIGFFSWCGVCWSCTFI